MVDLHSECNTSFLDNLPLGGKLLLYSILREDTIGCNTGGASLKYPNVGRVGVTDVVLYCHGLHGIIRSEYGGDLPGPTRKVDTIRCSVTKVKDTMRCVFNRLFVDETKTATREAFGAFRVEFSVRCTSVREGRDLLFKYLQEMGCEGMLSVDKDARGNALLHFLTKHGLKFCAVPMELVMHSLIQTTLDFQQMIRCLKTDRKKDLKDKMAATMEESEKRMLVRIHKELGQRKPSSAGLGQEIWSDIPRQYLLDIIKRVYLRPVPMENKEGQQITGYKLIRIDEHDDKDTKVIGHWDPMMAIAQGAWHALHNLAKTTKGRSKFRSVWSYCKEQGGFFSAFANCEYAEDNGWDIAKDLVDIKSELERRVQSSGRLPGRCTVRRKDLDDIADLGQCDVGVDRAQKFIKGIKRERDALKMFLEDIGLTKLGNLMRWRSKKGPNQDDVAFEIGRYKKRLTKVGWTCAFPERWWTNDEEMEKYRSEVTY